MTAVDTYKPQGQFISNAVLVLTISSYFDLFQFTFIPYPVRLVSSMAMSAVILLMIIIRIIYLPDHSIKMNFSFPILLMLIGSFPSYFIARYFHGQSFLITFYANRILWFYLLYFYVHLYKIPVSFVLRLIVFTGILAAVLFIIQYNIYPSRILDIKAYEERGALRMFVPGMICTVAAYFYFLNQFFEKTKIKHLLISFLCLSVFIMQGTRGYIFPLIFLTMVFLLLTKRIQAKFLIMIAVTLAAISVFIAFRQIFTELTKISTSQASNVGSNVRIKAARFFLTDYMPGKLAYLFGNGSPGPGSIYGQRSVFYNLKYGYYITDIGIIGDYVKFGVLFILGGLIMLLKSLTFKTSSTYTFLKYYILSQCFTLLTGYGLLGGVDVTIILILYIFDVDRDLNLRALNKADNPTDILLSTS